MIQQMTRSGLIWEQDLNAPLPDSGASDGDERFRLLADLAPIGILLRDANLECTYVNASWLAIGGLTRTEALGRGWLTAIHPEDRERLATAQAEINRTGSSWMLQLRYRRPDGEVRWVHGRTTPLRKADQTVTSYLVMVEDLTEWRRTERELADRERQYRLLFTHMNSGFALHRIVTDAAGEPIDYEFLALNDAYTEMTGLRAASTIGRRVTEVLPGTEHDPANWIKVFGDVALTGRTVRLEQYSQVVGKWFAVIAYRPEPLRFAVVMDDLSERKKLEWALAETSSREQRRLGNELHDGLGQHLTGIALMASGLANTARSSALPNAAELQRLAALASEAITTCRTIAHGLSPLGDSRGALRAALGAMVARHVELSGREVRYEEVGRAPLRLRDGAADHLYRIAQEALSNALRHSQALSIVMRLSVRSSRVRLEILDDGRGFDATGCEVTGIGIHSMRYRANLIGGALTIAARSGGGTAVVCVCPQLGLPSSAQETP